MEKYRIVRKYRDENHPRHNSVINSNLTLEEAMAHCNNPLTHEAGVWFDCFYEQDRKKNPGPSLTKALCSCSLYPSKGELKYVTSLRV